MKNLNFKKLILGIAFIFLSIIIAFGFTYIYDLVEGHGGRETVIIMFGSLISFMVFIVGFIICIGCADNVD